MKRSTLIILVASLVALCGAGIAAWTLRPRPAATKPTTTAISSQAPADAQPQADINSPQSYQVVVNKTRPLNPVSYTPTDLAFPKVPLRVPGHESMQLRAQAARSLEALFAGAKQSGLDLMLASGYRSYDYQVGLYNGYVASKGQAVADTQSARPGYSEHQTGLGLDVEPVSKKCELETCFAETSEGKWVAQHAHEYGFIIRYPEGKEAVTGYIYEPWHLRYVGIPIATEMRQKGIATLEEFFGLPPAPHY